MGRPRGYSSPQRRGRKVPQVHRLGPFVMLTLYPKSAACSRARHKHFPENFQRIVIPLFILTTTIHPSPPQHTQGPTHTDAHTHTYRDTLFSVLLLRFERENVVECGVLGLHLLYYLKINRECSQST